MMLLHRVMRALSHPPARRRGREPTQPLACLQGGLRISPFPTPFLGTLFQPLTRPLPCILVPPVLHKGLVMPLPAWAPTLAPHYPQYEDQAPQ